MELMGSPMCTLGFACGSRGFAKTAAGAAKHKKYWMPPDGMENWTVLFLRVAGLTLVNSRSFASHTPATANAAVAGDPGSLRMTPAKRDDTANQAGGCNSSSSESRTLAMISTGSFFLSAVR